MSLHILGTFCVCFCFTCKTHNKVEIAHPCALSVTVLNEWVSVCSVFLFGRGWSHLPKIHVFFFTHTTTNTILRGKSKDGASCYFFVFCCCLCIHNQGHAQNTKTGDIGRERERLCVCVCVSVLCVFCKPQCMCAWTLFFSLFFLLSFFSFSSSLLTKYVSQVTSSLNEGVCEYLSLIIFLAFL